MVNEGDHDETRGEQTVIERATGSGMAGLGAPAVVLQGPGGIGDALCQVGVGVLITAFLYLGALVLAYLAIVDFLNAAAASNSRSGSQHARREHLSDGAVKLVGAVIVAGLPTILSGLGFTLLTCVDAVNIFGGGTAALIALA